MKDIRQEFMTEQSIKELPRLTTIIAKEVWDTTSPCGLSHCENRQENSPRKLAGDIQAVPQPKSKYAS